jgi:hypothetical protein
MRDWKRGNAPIFRQLRIDDDLLDPHDLKTRAEDAGAEFRDSRIDGEKQRLHRRGGRGLKSREKVRRRKRRRRRRRRRKRRSGLVEERSDTSLLSHWLDLLLQVKGGKEREKEGRSASVARLRRKKRSTR